MCRRGGWLAGRCLYAVGRPRAGDGCNVAGQGGEENVAEAGRVWRRMRAAGGGVCSRLSARSWPVDAVRLGLTRYSKENESCPLVDSSFFSICFAAGRGTLTPRANSL